MKPHHRLSPILAALMIASAAVPHASAQLPSLEEQPWLGYFAVYQSRRFDFGLSGVGKIVFFPKNEKGERVADHCKITVNFGIEEVLPDGTTRKKMIQEDSLQSADTATDELVKTVVTGKVTGDAAFEVTIEQDRGIISIGGRITDQGTLTKDPIRFTAAANLPNVYVYVEKTEKKDQKTFEKKIKNDRVDLKWADGKRYRKSMDETVDVNTKEVNGPGITTAEIEMSAYEAGKLVFGASENSLITLSNPAPAPLYEGFTLNWHPDASKDPEGKARLRITLK